MQTIKLSEKLNFSRIIQGFWRLTDWEITTDELIDFIKECINRGVTTFDTAEVYGDNECERQIGLALKKDPSLRKQMQIVTKAGVYKEILPDGAFGYYNTSYDRIMQSCKQSLERLQCDYIDLYLIHREDPCFDPWETARALNDLKKQGLILEAGVSNFDPIKYDALNTAMNGTLVTNQIEWNPLCFEHFSSGMMDMLAKLKTHPMLWSPLAGGRLFKDDNESTKNVRNVLKKIAQKYNTEVSTIVYAWLMYHPVKAMPISGSKELFRLDEAIAALDIKMEHWEWYKIFVASGEMVLR